MIVDRLLTLKVVYVCTGSGLDVSQCSYYVDVANRQVKWTSTFCHLIVTLVSAGHSPNNYLYFCMFVCLPWKHKTLCLTNTSCSCFPSAVWHLPNGTWPISDQFQQRHPHPLLHLPFSVWLPLWFNRPEVKLLLSYSTQNSFFVDRLHWHRDANLVYFVPKDPREQLPCLQSLLFRLWKLPDGSHSGDLLPSTGRKERVPQLGAWHWRNEARVSADMLALLLLCCSPNKNR